MNWTASRVARAAEMATATEPRAFARTPDSRMVVETEQSTRLPQPQIILSDRGKPLRFCAPFLLLDEVGRPPTGFPAQVRAPEMAMTRLRDVTCLPGQVALRERQGAREVLAESFISLWDWGHQTLSAADGRISGPDYAQPEPLPGVHLYLDCEHRNHFGHFIADVLTMAWAHARLRELGLGEAGVLMTHAVAPFMAPMLQALGVPPNRLTPVDRPLRVEHVVFATKSLLVQGWTSPTAQATWRRIEGGLNTGETHERVFVTRPGAGNRGMRDVETVEAVFAARGFIIFRPEQHDIATQVSVFANASLIAGLSGSNMFSLGFQTRLRSLFLICSPNLVHFSEQFFMGGHCGSMTLFVGEADSDGAHDPWRIVPDALERAVDAWLGQELG